MLGRMMCRYTSNSVGHQVKFSPGWKQLVELTKNCEFAYIINPEFLSEVLLYQINFSKTSK